jgi:hypothetical protein
MSGAAGRVSTSARGAQTCGDRPGVAPLAQMERDFVQRVPDSLYIGRYGLTGVLPYALQVGDGDAIGSSFTILRTFADAPARAA